MTGFIYFLRCGEFVKIGYSKEPENRLRYFETGSPYDFEMLAVHPGSERDEAALHRLLAAYRHKGEWFCGCAEIAAIVANGIPKFSHPVIDSASADAAMKRACDIAGGQSALAKKLGVRQSHVWHWVHRSKNGVPAEFAPAVEKITGVPRHELRPDVFERSVSA